MHTTTLKTIEANQGTLPLLWTKTQTARALACCVRTVENEVKKRSLAAVKIGKRCVRFRPEDVHRFIASRRLHAAGE